MLVQIRAVEVCKPQPKEKVMLDFGDDGEKTIYDRRIFSQVSCELVPIVPPSGARPLPGLKLEVEEVELTDEVLQELLIEEPYSEFEIVYD